MTLGGGGDVVAGTIGLSLTGLTWLTWKVGCTRRDRGRRSRTAAGPILLVTGVVILDEEDCRNKIAFNSLYLFSFKSIIYKQMARYCIIHARRKTRPLRSCIWVILAASPRSVFKKRHGGVASTTRDRGYPDWLVLSALLRLLRSGYQGSAKYVYIYVLVVFG